MGRMRNTLAVVCVALWGPFGVSAQERGSVAIERSIAALPQSCYFVLPPKQPPKDGAGGLVVVLPGGDGSRDFLPWVENGLLAQRPDDCTGVLVTAVKWRDDQRIVWPTAQSKVPDMRYTTEDYVRAVVHEVEQAHRIDPARRVVVAWSSSGPAVYPLLCAEDGPFARGYVAMSIWPRDLRDLAAAKGRRFFLDQSPEDKVTPFRFVRQAHAALDKAGAVVRVSVYDGGHGWHDEPLPRFREGLRWLLGDEPAPAPEWPGANQRAKKPAKKGKPGKNLLTNGGFEKGLDGWRTIDNSGRVTAEATKDEHPEGKRALHVHKTGGMPLDLVTQEVDLPAGSTLTATAMVKSKAAGNAWLKVWLYDAAGEPIGKDVDLLRVPKDGDWQRVEKTWSCEGAERAVVQLIMVLDGDVWLDDVVLSVVE